MSAVRLWLCRRPRPLKFVCKFTPRTFQKHPSRVKLRRFGKIRGCPICLSSFASKQQIESIRQEFDDWTGKEFCFTVISLNTRKTTTVVKQSCKSSRCMHTAHAFSVNQPSHSQSREISCRCPSKSHEYLQALTGRSPRRRNGHCCSGACRNTRRNWTASIRPHRRCHRRCHRCPRTLGRRGCRPACRPLALRWCSACGGRRQTCSPFYFGSDCPAVV